MFATSLEDRVALPVQLRDWFAGQALAGFMRSRSSELYNEESIRWYARTAYELADAMMAERSGPQAAKVQKAKTTARPPAWKGSAFAPAQVSPS